MSNPEKAQNYSEAPNEQPLEAPQNTQDDPWSSLEQTPFSKEAPNYPEESKNQDIEDALSIMKEYHGQLKEQQSKIEKELEDINSTIEQYEGSMRMLENETKATGEVAGSRRRKKSNVVSRFLQSSDLGSYTRKDLVKYLEPILETHDVDIVIKELSRDFRKDQVGDNYDRLLPYCSAEELFPCLSAKGVEKNLASLLFEGINPKEVLSKLSPAQVLNNIGTFEKYGISINADNYLPRIDSKSIPRNIGYLAKNGASFKGIIGSMAPEDIFYQDEEDKSFKYLDTLKKLDDFDVDTIYKRLGHIDGGPINYTEAYHDVLESYREKEENEEEKGPQ